MRKTIAQIAMEAQKFSQSNEYSNKERLSRKYARMYRVSQEGFFDFFRKKEEPSIKPASERNFDPDAYAQELREAKKVSINLYTTSIENEIKYLEDMLHNGLPFLQKDIERYRKAFEFVIANHKDIGDKIPKLVDVAYPDASYKIDEDNKIRFKTFYLAIYNYHTDKVKQSWVGQGWLDADMALEVEEMFGLDPVDDMDEVENIAKLYCLNEAVPHIENIRINEDIRASKKQHVVYLEKDDPKLLKLIGLNLAIIEKCSHILTEKTHKEFKNLAYKADRLTHPKPYGDGDELGMSHLVIHDLWYMYDIRENFKRNFIMHYSAH